MLFIIINRQNILNLQNTIFHNHLLVRQMTILQMHRIFLSLIPAFRLVIALMLIRLMQFTLFQWQILAFSLKDSFFYLLLLLFVHVRSHC